MKVLGLAMLAPTCLVSYFISSGDNMIAITAHIVFYVSAIVLYLFPSICVVLTESPPTHRIFFINILLGWTLVGWCAAYYLALCSKNTHQAEENLSRL